MSSFISHDPCPDCGSSDALAQYDDGHGYCFSCPANTAYKSPDGSRPAAPEEQARHKAPLYPYVIPDGLPKRGLRQATLRKWQYGVTLDGTRHVANYLDGGELVGQKTRDADKKMAVAGKLTPLYGQWLWKDGGRILVITEGELDALSVSQANGLKYPVVSISKGAAGAARCIREALEFVESYEKVVFMFDMDEPGQTAAKECAALLSPNRAWIAHLSEKDPNAVLLAGKDDELRTAVFTARRYRPDGIMTADDVRASLRAYKAKPIAHLPFQVLDTKTRGYRSGEILLCCGGISSGKSTIMKEIAFSAREQGLRVGIVTLEEPVPQYVHGLTSIKLNKNLRLEDDIPQEDPAFWGAVDGLLEDDGFIFYDDSGQRDSDSLFSTIRYMAVALGVQLVIFDHLTIVVGGSSEENDRRHADRIMGQLEALVKRTGVTVVVVMHLKKAGEGLSHEQGRTVSMADIRGSGMIPALSHTIFAFERDLYADDPTVGELRLLRCRWTGATGPAGKLRWCRETGRLRDYVEPDADGLGGSGAVLMPEVELEEVPAF